MKRAAWLDGEPMDAITAANRALNYGDGVFRTMLAVDGQVLDLARHLRVLWNDCRRLYLDPPASDELDGALRSATRNADEWCVLKLMVIRRDKGRGYCPSGRDSQPLLRREPAPRYPLLHWTHGIVAMQSPVCLAEQPLLAGVKHLNRLEQVLASRDWPSGVDEVILRDVHGRPASGSRSNLFWVTRGVVWTPALKMCGVHGMMRGKVLDCAHGLGLPCRVADAAWKALLVADEAFVTNSLVGIWPLRRLDAHIWGPPGPVTAALQRHLAHPHLCAERGASVCSPTSIHES